MPAPCTRLHYQRDTDLCTAVTAAHDLFVCDSHTFRVVRQFVDVHSQPVTALSVSGDGRWVVTACVDASVRVFDLPTARMIDW